MPLLLVGGGEAEARRCHVTPQNCVCISCRKGHSLCTYNPASEPASAHVATLSLACPW